MTPAQIDSNITARTQLFQVNGDTYASRRFGQGAGRPLPPLLLRRGAREPA